MSDPLSQAMAAHQAGNLAEAEKLYRQTLAAKPDHADALALLGLVRSAQNEHDEAVGLVERAVKLDPDAPLFALHQGNILMAANRFPDSAAAFRRAVQLQPNLALAHYNLGNALRKNEDWQGAIEAYRQALKLDPNQHEGHNNLALALVHEKKYDAAMEAAERALALAPGYGDGWLTLCNVAEQVGNYPRALEAGIQNVRLQPNSHRAWFGYGVALSRLMRFEEAIEAYKNAVSLKPDRADIWDNLGQSYQSLNRLPEAETAFRKTIEVAGQVIPCDGTREVDESEYGNRHWHLALAELLQGKLKQGFARYRARFKDIGDLKRPDFPCPLWKGENLAGKSILVCDEQGFGDTLMFCRYLPMLKDTGAKVVFSVHPALEPLFRDWSGADQIVVHKQPFAPVDFYTTTFDLPHRFGTALETIPAHVPYLPLPEPTPETKIESRKPKIGVVWGGSPLHKNDSNRSIPLALFSKLFALPAQFYSLNRDLKEGDGELLPRLSVIDLAPKLKNFADAARFMRQLDLVITCDTATAHLAGGLGVPVWVLLPFAPDWRWLLGRDDSPWYPSMRLFRQGKIGGWDGVLARVEKALAEQL